MSLQLSGMSHGRDKELPHLLEQLMEMLIEHTFGYILHCNLRQKAKLCLLSSPPWMHTALTTLHLQDAFPLSS